MELIWTIVAALVTIAIYSFLYKDNPLYKAAEHIAVGVSVGFIIVLYYNTIFLPKVWDNVMHNGKYDYIIPFVLGVLLFTRFIPKRGWMSRIAIAFTLGAGAGVAIPLTLEARVLKQMEGSIASLISLDPTIGFQANALATLGALFLVLGTLACLVFFLFSVEHKGSIGRFAYFGRLCIMAGFGASFGYTVMARVSLLIGRVQFLTREFTDAVANLF